MMFLKAAGLTLVVVGVYWGVKYLYDLAYARLLVRTTRDMAMIKPMIVEAAF